MNFALFYQIIKTYKFYKKGEINVQDHKKNNCSLLNSLKKKKLFKEDILLSQNTKQKHPQSIIFRAIYLKSFKFNKSVFYYSEMKGCI